MLVEEASVVDIGTCRMQSGAREHVGYCGTLLEFCMFQNAQTACVKFRENSQEPKTDILQVTG